MFVGRDGVDRRHFIVGGSLLTCMPSMLQASLRCTPYNGNGIQICEVGIPSLSLIQARQACPQWCWAASIQMIFALGGRLLPQEQIVERLYPDVRCSPANGPQIIATVNSGPWQDMTGRIFNPNAYTLADFDFGYQNANAALQAAQHLAAGIPLITGALGHATVMTAMSYYRDATGNAQVESITVRDPWPGNPPRRVLTAAEVQGTRLLIAIN